MQYKGYELQITSEGTIVRDNAGNYIISTPDEEEAKDYVDDLIMEDPIEQKDIIKNRSTNWYDRFIKYCNKLPGKIFIDNGKLASTNGLALNKFAKSFEELNHVVICITNQYIDGELFYIVNDIIE